MQNPQPAPSAGNASRCSATADLPDAPPSLPPPPRPITALARRRAWLEPSVRFWWLSAAILAAMTGYLATDRIIHYQRTRNLVDHGQAVQATVIVPGVQRGRLAGNTAITLQFDRSGRTWQVAATAADVAPDLSARQVVTIRVDPDNPRRWTALTRVPPLWQALLAPGLLVPAVLAPLAISLWRRARLLSLYRNGRPQVGLVVQVYQSALSPFSRTVRCTLRDEPGRRLLTVQLPPRTAFAQHGQVMWLLVSGTGRAGRAMAASAFAPPAAHPPAAHPSAPAPTSS